MTTDGLRLREFLLALNLPAGHWAVGGSGVMHIHGVYGARPLGDVDLFVTARLYRVLLASGDWEEQRPHPQDPPFLELDLERGVLAKEVDVPVHAFAAWSTRRFIFDVPWAVHHCEYIHGVPCIPLNYVYHLKWIKSGLMADDETEPKHASDLHLLDDHLDRMGDARWRPVLA